jgi:hypothetical protein
MVKKNDIYGRLFIRKYYENLYSGQMTIMLDIMSFVAPDVANPAQISPQSQITTSIRCNGAGHIDYNCCSSRNLCGKGMGDCDFNNDCFLGLKCGTNNCWRDFGVGNWESQADCCYGISQVYLNWCYLLQIY